MQGPNGTGPIDGTKWAGPNQHVTGAGTEMLVRGVEDCHGSVWSNAVGESLSDQSPEADELDIGRW